MAVSDREFNGLVDTVVDHGKRLRKLERIEDERRGAAREEAKFASRIVALVGVLGMIGQLAISALGHRLGLGVIAHEAVSLVGMVRL